MKHARTLTVALAITALGLTGCGDGEQSDPEPQEPEQSAAEDTGADENAEPETAEEDAEFEDDTASEDTTENDDDAADSLTVETEGRGPYGLYTAEPPAGDPEEVTGKLIIGPGSCMSLVDDDQPQLLVFGEDADFVLREDQPGVTTDELGRVDVGEQIELSAVEISQDSVDGIPDQCAQGAAGTVLIIG